MFGKELLMEKSFYGAVRLVLVKRKKLLKSSYEIGIIGGGDGRYLKLFEVHAHDSAVDVFQRLNKVLSRMSREKIEAIDDLLDALS